VEITLGVLRIIITLFSKERTMRQMNGFLTLAVVLVMVVVPQRADSQDFLCSSIPGSVNFTQTLQDSINVKHFKRFIFDGSPGKVYQMGRLFLEDSITILIEDSVTVNAANGAFTPGYAWGMFEALNKKRIRIQGEGPSSRVKMRIDDYDSGEWLMCILLRLCVDVKIENLSLVKSGGDGVYVGATDTDTVGYCEGISIKNVTFDGHARQGISFISVKNATVENCVFKNTGKYNHDSLAENGPWAGIDFEPNHFFQRLENIVVKNCSFSNNRGYGVLFSLQQLRAWPPTNPLSTSQINITLSGLVINGDSIAGIRLHRLLDEEIAGSIAIDNCLIKNTTESAFVVDGWIPGQVTTVIDSCSIINPTEDEEHAAIEFRDYSSAYPDGNISMTNIEVTDNDISRYLIKFDDGSPGNEFKDIDCQINTDDRNAIIKYGYYYDDVTVTRAFLDHGFGSFNTAFFDSADQAGGTDNEAFMTDPSALVFPGDFDGDGQTDLFVKGYETFRALYLAEPQGTGFDRVFMSDSDNVAGTDSEPFFTDPSALVFPGDYNGDGKADLFVKGYQTYRALYLANSSGEGFNRVFMTHLDNVGGTADSEAFFTDPSALVFPGDYNGDGRTDLFVKGWQKHRALYLANSSGNGFDRAFLGTTTDTAGTDEEGFFTDSTALVFPGDYNGDGKTDLFVKGYQTHRLLYLAEPSGASFKRVFLGVGAGTDDGGMNGFSALTDPSALVFPGDYNGDGRTDLFLKGYQTWRALYTANSSGSGFDSVFATYLDSQNDGTDSEAFLTDSDALVFPGDYDGDGKTDLFVKGYQTYRLLYISEGGSFNRVFMGYGQGVGGTDSNAFFTDPSALVFSGDYNGDGKADIFVKGYQKYRGLYLSSAVPLGAAYLGTNLFGKPSQPRLAQNYPNPFNPSTIIAFDLPEPGRVTLKLYDVLGREVLTILDRQMPAGYHPAELDASAIPSGAYFYRLETPGGILTRKMVLLK